MKGERENKAHRRRGNYVQGVKATNVLMPDCDENGEKNIKEALK